MSGVRWIPLSVLIAGCAQPLDPERGRSLEWSFPIHRLQHEPPFLGYGGVGGVTIRGYFTAPCMPYEAQAGGEVRAGVVTLRVVGSNEDDCPLRVVQSYGYQARLHSVPAGEYRVLLIHEWKDINRPAEVVFETHIAVR